MFQIQENSKELLKNFQKEGKFWSLELNPKNDTEYLIKTNEIKNNSSKNQKHKIQINLKNPKQKIYLKFIGSLQNEENLDLEIVINHQAKETKSESQIKLAARNKAKIKFIGTIKIQPKAENTNANLNIKSLLLSQNSSISANPNLEIQNKKTSCSHGATISGINKKQIEYLMHKGLKSKKAEELILDGFLEI